MCVHVCVHACVFVHACMYMCVCMQGVNIPLTATALDGLINKLDADSDGEVDFRSV